MQRLAATALLLSLAAPPAYAGRATPQPQSARRKPRYRWGKQSAAQTVTHRGLRYHVEARAERGPKGWRLVTRVTTSSRDRRAYNVIDGSIRTKTRVWRRSGRSLVLGYTRFSGPSPSTVRVSPGHPQREIDRTTLQLESEGYLEVTVAVLPAVPAHIKPTYGYRLPLAMLRLEVDKRGRLRRVGAKPISHKP
ncbi:MAG: hypothetical protein KC503_04255 [Myxococcales bacterium]|nr:hypothetical protein [Myxococcales bacterium]